MNKLITYLTDTKNLKLMKKTTFLLFAAMHLLLMSCNENKLDNNPIDENMRKLPKRTVGLAVYPDGSSLIIGPDETYQYDDLYRLDKVVDADGRILRLTYNSDNTPAKFGNTAYRYTEDTIFVDNGSYQSIDTLILNSEDQLVKRMNKGYDYDYSYKYDSNGNLIEINNNGSELVKMGYSKLPSIWEHVNMPGWFICYHFGDYHNLNGNMVLKYTQSKKEATTNISYELNSDSLPHITTHTMISPHGEFINEYYYEYISVK